MKFPFLLSPARSLCLMLLLVTSAGSQAAEQATDDIHSGEALHANNCVRCHTTEVYTRPDHKVKDLAGLTKQVNTCNIMLEMKWFDEDVQSVSSYLNEHFYKFPTNAD